MISSDVGRRELRRRLAQRPNAVRFSELRAMLEAYGWWLDRVEGSHHIFRRSRNKVSVPLKRPHVLATYVRQALKLTEGEDDEDDD